MPRLRTTLAASLLALPGAAAAQEPPAGIEWAASLAEAQRSAAASGRPVIAYFTFDT